MCVAVQSRVQARQGVGHKISKGASAETARGRRRSAISRVQARQGGQRNILKRASAAPPGPEEIPNRPAAGMYRVAVSSSIEEAAKIPPTCGGAHGPPAAAPPRTRGSQSERPRESEASKWKAL